MRKLLLAGVSALALSSCAGRTPNPVAVSQPQDPYMTCENVQAEIAANNNAIKDLSSESGGKVAQNIAAGVAGLFIWPLWFAMDFQDAPGRESDALQGRNNYLASVASAKCATTPDDGELALNRPQRVRPAPVNEVPAYQPPPQL
jgi:hypothetical protein